VPHLTLPISSGGPLIDIFVGISAPRREALIAAGIAVSHPLAVRALIDTGASCSSIDSAILRQLGITPSGIVPVHTPSTTLSNPHLANEFDVSLLLSHPRMDWQFDAVRVIESELSHQGFTALLGRDILRDCLFSYDGPTDLFTLAF
jgi:hypothetical protein